MANNRISRRSVVPGLAVGATAALAGTLASESPVVAAPSRESQLQAGPCGLWRGQTITFSVFVPAGARPAGTTNRFRLKLVVIAIIAILIGLLLPGVPAPLATMTATLNNAQPGTVTYLVPFVGQ